MRVDEYDLDCCAAAGADTKFGLQGATEAFNKAHSQGIRMAGIVLRG